MFVVNLLLVCLSIIFLVFIARLFLHRTALIYVVRRWAEWVDDRVHVHQRFTVPELDDSTQRENHLYRRVSLYVSSLSSIEDSDSTKLISGKKPNDIVLSPDDDQVVPDSFLGARVSWVNRILRDDGNRIVSRSFVLRIKKKDKRRILQPYLQHIHAVSDDLEQRRRELRIHNNVDGRWRSIPFDHPANFESLVMDPELKTRIRNELETFLKSKQYYQKLGRVWKRSYLLYGASGTGKSSFITAAANLLCFDVYNFNLSMVSDDGDLNSLLLQTSSESLIVVEDFDRYLSEKSRSGRITSSGMLNFMDGILNFHDERIMIFTVNCKDGIDSDLLRPGRIDVHIYFPMCDFNSFKCLASNYLGVKEHKLFPQVEEIFQSGATMSPAEISELMLVNRSSPSRALKSVISALQSTNGRIGGKVAQRPSDSAASSPAPPYMWNETGGAAWKETVPKEFRKLYGLLRMKSCRRPGSFDLEPEMIER